VWFTRWFIAYIPKVVEGQYSKAIQIVCCEMRFQDRAKAGVQPQKQARVHSLLEKLDSRLQLVVPTVKVVEYDAPLVVGGEQVVRERTQYYKQLEVGCK
jgi:hypothetical protein